jgi:hypothetical protein
MQANPPQPRYRGFLFPNRGYRKQDNTWLTGKIAMAKYTDEERANVIMMLHSTGFYDGDSGDGAKTSSVRKVQGYFKGKYSERTIFRWGNGENNPAPDKLVNTKKRDMADEFKELVWLLVDHVKDADTIGEMSGQQAVTSIGILVDKMRLLMGLPTTIVGIMPDVMSALERAGEDPEQVFKRLIETANKRADERINRN